MASTCDPSPSQDSNFSKSVFQNTVCLFDWWLIRAEKDFQGKTLAVAGFTSRKQHVQQVRRMFKSAPIHRIHDFCTLETADGICVVIMGLINKLQTTENGFASEVFNHFLFGFPPNWAEYASEDMGEGINTEPASESSSPDPTYSEGVSNHKLGEKSCQDKVAQTDSKDTGSNFSGVDVEMEKMCHTPSTVDQQRSSPGQTGGKGRRMVKGNRLCKDKARERTPLVHQQKSTYGQAGGEGSRKVTRNMFSREKTGERTQTGLHGSSFTSPDSFKRSRSGRLLLPRLEFWRNQVAIYDAERKISGIKEGLDLSPEPRGTGTSSVRKYRPKR